MTVRMTCAAAAAAMDATLVQGDAPLGDFQGLAIDSRAVSADQAFVAIAGDRFDGHRFCGQAAAQGAALLVVSQWPLPDVPSMEVPVALVADTRAALGALARAWRDQVAPAVVALTGSVGKTTTKELLRNILALCGPTHATPGNFNNDIGLPLTLLSMPADTRLLVAEMGMNAAGEIAALTRLAGPDVGLITRVAPVHLEGLGSVEAVAAAKAELLLELGPEACAVLPDDEPLLDPWAGRLSGQRILRFGEAAGSDARILDLQSLGLQGARIRLDLAGQIQRVHLPLVGAYNARNAAAAAAAALALDVDPRTIAAGLEQRPELSHRSVVREVGRWSVLDDCYNANPVGMKVALDTLAELAAGGAAVAVLGDMLELGERAIELHREVGIHAAGIGLSLLVAVGQLGRQIGDAAVEAGMEPQRVLTVDHAGLVAEELNGRMDPSWLLVKASRGAQLERVIDGLSQATNGQLDPAAAGNPQPRRGA